ncbi:MAG: histidine phosphatase family protein [Dehalococcoidia bacterium]|nr:MAG: histidine phosphatase family protein [Dehalococcoidia bacterium]
MRLILVRHGETEHNKDGMTLGRFDAPLNERGLAQAKAVAGSFRRAPEAIYASPLERAAYTAELIGAETGVAVSTEEQLIEMDVGEMEHLSLVQLRERYPEFLRAWGSADAAEARMPGGETLAEVQERAWSAVERMHAAHRYTEVVAVTHNFVILTIVCRAIGLPLADFRRLRQALASKTILEFHEHGQTLLQLNDNSHLIAAGLGDDVSPPPRGVSR